MKYWRLRWCFVYKTKTPIYGVWSFDTPFPTREGLDRVEIQAQMQQTQVTVVVDQCPAHEFAEFKWVGQVKVIMRKGLPAHTMSPTLIGLELVRVNGKKTTVLIDGTFRKEP